MNQNLLQYFPIPFNTFHGIIYNMYRMYLFPIELGFPHELYNCSLPSTLKFIQTLIPQLAYEISSICFTYPKHNITIYLY